MVKVEIGTVVPKATIKSGSGDKGRWLFGKIKAEKGYDEITVWATNPDDLNPTCDQTVVSIESVSKTNKKSTTDGKWYNYYNVNAMLSSAVKAGSSTEVIGFEPLDDDTIPF